MNQATALLGLITETSLHAGAGSSVGAVDLPIQREGHNGWPCVFGSAVKGSLRDVAESKWGSTGEDIYAVFGPDMKNASDNAGAIAVGDARLLLLPVRSLTTAFKWVTCPEALNRLKRDAERLGLSGQLGIDVPSVAGTEAKIASGTGDLFLEEYRLTLVPDTKVAALAEPLAKLMRRDGAEVELKERLTIVADDLFSHLTRAAIPVNAHIALDSGTKTVTDGALWYEETLPPETLLYVPLVAVKARRKDSTLDAAAVRRKIIDLFAERPWLQLGGNETVGMGWCAATVLEG
jgi:CRISPR-associated protein Cmr4